MNKHEDNNKHFRLESGIYARDPDNAAAMLDVSPYDESAVGLGTETLRVTNEERRKVASAHPFKVALSYNKTTNQTTATMAAGLIFASDMTFEDPKKVTHDANGKAIKTVVNNDDFLAIKQTLNSDGSSKYEIDTVRDGDDLVVTDSEDDHFASATYHIIAKIETIPDSNPSRLRAIQYTTTNLVRTVSTHSGAVYYRLLPR